MKPASAPTPPPEAPPNEKAVAHASQSHARPGRVACITVEIVLDLQHAREQVFCWANPQNVYPKYWLELVRQIDAALEGKP